MKDTLLETYNGYRIYRANGTIVPKGGIYVTIGDWEYLQTDNTHRRDASNGWFDSLTHVHKVLGIQETYLGGE